jgi:hypothetical protein
MINVIVGYANVMIFYYAPKENAIVTRSQTKTAEGKSEKTNEKKEAVFQSAVK